MQLFTLGLNHQTAPLAIRETCGIPCRTPAFGAGGADPARAGQGGGDPLDLQPHRDLLRARRAEEPRSSGSPAITASSPRSSSPTSTRCRRREAVRHAFRVAVRPRFDGGRRAADPRTDEGSGARRRVRGHARNASQQALPALVRRSEGSAQQYRNRRQRRFDGRGRGEARRQDISQPFASQKVLLIGAGEMIELAATHFAAQRPRAMAVANRTLDRARDARAPLRRGGDRAARSARASARVRHRGVLHGELAADHRQGHDGAHGPRAAAPPRSSWSTWPCRATSRPKWPAWTTCFSIPSTIWPPRCARASTRASRRVAQAEVIIESQVGSFLHWMKTREMVPLIRQLRESAEEARSHEVERAVKMLARGDDPEGGARGAFARPHQQADARPDRGAEPGAAREIESLTALVARSVPPPRARLADARRRRRSR